LVERGHRPRLITSHPGPTTRTVEDGFEIVRHRRRLEGLIPPDWESHLVHLPASWLSLRRGEFDLAHAVFPTDGMLAARWSELTGRPALLTYLGVPEGPWLAAARLRRRILHRALRSCTPVALSRAAADEFRRSLGVDAPVIHPGVDLDVFAPGEGRADQPTIVCAAALDEPRKRVGLLIEAFELVRRRRRDARLILDTPRGSAPRPPGLDRPGIELRDLDDRARLAATYREAWVSALPSIHEALGLVLVEALACGTPVVGTNHLGIPEVIDRDEIGRLFDGDAPAALAEALLEALDLARDPRTPEACRRRAEDFSKERMVGAYEDLYRELLERRQAHRS
jgi:phosphatidylinositol alpha-mannosyltransferase